MNKEQYLIWINENEKLFKIEQKPYLYKKFAELTEEQFLMCSNLNYKNPTVITIFSIFLGHLGVDRFMLGQIGLGIVKLLLWLIFPFNLIWWIIDWFVVGKKARQYNIKILIDTLLIFENSVTK